MTETADHGFEHLPRATAGLGSIFARPKAVAALCVVTLAGLGWLYLGAMLPGMSEYSGRFAVLQALCGSIESASWSVRGTALVISMWCAMALATMLPSAAPMIMTYAEIADTAARKRERIVSPFVLAGGYATVWIGFSIVAALAQVAMMQTKFLDTGIASASGLFSGTIFIAAGCYQFSLLKHACLTQCQRPFPFFFANWTTTPVGVFRLGLKQGGYCLGCCWAMMLLTFAVGSMNVIWMTALGILMTIEKMLGGRRFTYALGAALILLGISILLMALAAHWARA